MPKPIYESYTHIYIRVWVIIAGCSILVLAFDVYNYLAPFVVGAYVFCCWVPIMIIHFLKTDRLSFYVRKNYPKEVRTGLIGINVWTLLAGVDKLKEQHPNDALLDWLSEDVKDFLMFMYIVCFSLPFFGIVAFVRSAVTGTNS
jgi:hypothetical protein